MVITLLEEEGEEVVVVETEEAVFIRDSITEDDLPNAHQAQDRPKPRFDEYSVHPKSVAGC